MFILEFKLWRINTFFYFWTLRNTVIITVRASLQCISNNFALVNQNYFRAKRKNRGGKANKRKREEKEKSPGSQDGQTEEGEKAEKVGGDEVKDEPVVYIDAPIPAANPWKKSSLSPEPVAAATVSPPAAQNTQIEKDNKSAKPVSW